MANKRNEFLMAVTSHMKSAEAGSFVSRELNDHINCEKKRLMKKGMMEEEAEIAAIRQMGNPAEIGRDFNKIHRPKVDWWLTGLLLITMCFSFLPMLIWNVSGSDHFLKMRAATTVLGLGLTFSLMLIDYRKLVRFHWLFFGVGFVILSLINFFPNTSVNGKPFFNIGPLTLESTMALLFLYLGWSVQLAKKNFKLWQVLILFIGTSYLIFMSINIPLVFVYSVMVFVMMMTSRMSRMKKKIIVASAVAGVLSIAIFFLTAAQPYQKERLLAFLNPDRFAESSGYMYIRLKEAFSQAGWFGQFGQEEFIPSGHTDFVFASFTYQFGWLLGLVLLVVLGLLMGRMIVNISKIKDPFGKMLLSGGVTLFTVQFLYNIGMMLGFLPLIGISLPFISYGLMPTILNSMVVGIVLSVYRRKDIVQVSV
ncbi:FtsW/RodA/SpoVE family cell cycle protein [Rossellomorea vietnamensis]|uniref:FtsW/RodA/SpoVE family cell cycle protein n=1 Tax=Rossellomorea vietnamensis TaxID=218284 RepID=UPI003CEA8B14